MLIYMTMVGEIATAIGAKYWLFIKANKNTYLICHCNFSVILRIPLGIANRSSTVTTVKITILYLMRG